MFNYSAFYICLVLAVIVWAGTFAYASRLETVATNGAAEIYNPQIDFDGFLKESQKVASIRAGRRVTLEKFFHMAKEPNTIILDARSTDKYAMKHIKGAKHLAFTDFTEANLAEVIPSKDTRVLIYCNNNFKNNSREFMTKSFSSSLNISTFISLSDYGYHNVYELGPALDEHDRRLTFEASPGLISDY